MAGRDRKNSLKALFGDAMTPAVTEPKPAPAAGNSDADANPAAANPPELPVAPPPRASSGAIKAMGLSLSNITRDAEEARALRVAMEDGERIISLETDRIAGSFVSDRLSEEDRDDPDFLTLVESIRENGQQTPILVRPHPDQQGRFQVAYGHRRLKAVRRLGQTVKAIIRPLTDSELVLAQGKENAERRNLSFIERAIFAKALVERSFDRKIVGDALAVQKSELSRLLQVAEAVPEAFIRAIGPAPKVGRERWMALGQLFTEAGAEAKAEAEIAAERFRASQTDERFQMLFERLMRRKPTARIETEVLISPNGKVFARVNRQGKAVKIEFSTDADPAFIEAAMARLTEEYARFVGQTSG